MEYIAKYMENTLLGQLTGNVDGSNKVFETRYGFMDHEAVLVFLNGVLQDSSTYKIKSWRDGQIEFFSAPSQPDVVAIYYAPKR
jgi:hypothetical protein